MNLSIVIPVYNSEKYLGNCLDSLIDQNLPPDELEIIAINDGSTDESLEILKSYQAKYPFIKIHDQENQGVSATRNLGIDLTKGKYLYFIDGDDYLVSNVMGEMLEVLIQENLDILTIESTKTESLDLYKSTTDKNLTHKPKTLTGEEYIEQGYRFEIWGYICNTEFLRNTGIRFDTGRVIEDPFFTTMVFLKARRMAHFPLDAHRYLQVPGSVMKSSSPKHLMKTAEDMRYFVHQFEGLIDEYSAKSPKIEPRLRAKQDNLVFFVIIRLIRSNVPFKYLKDVIADLRKTRGYPMKKFMSLENSGLIYGLLTFAVNHKSTLFIFFYGYRILRKLKR